MARLRAAISFAVALCALASVLLASRPARAFPWMIREGYTGCNTCHADPSGAGILTAYGRGMEEVVTRMPYKKDADPGKLGNFAFGVDLPEQLLLQTDFRNLFMTVFPSGGSNPQFQDFVMQLDQSAQLKIGRFRMNGSIGYSPPTATGGNFTFAGGGYGASLTDMPSQDGALLARQYWLGVDIGKDEEFLLRAGRMNVPYGIRFIEHPYFVRQVTRTDIDKGQEHGVSLAYTGEKVRGEVMAILGNYAVGPDAFRERGGSAFFEWMPTNKIAVGASAMITHADLARTDYDPSLALAPIWSHAYAIHARVSPVKALVLLAEVDGLLNSQLVSGVAQNHGGMTGVLQADLEVYQGIHVLAAGEFYNGHIGESCAAGIDYCTTTASAWLGAWWFFAPHFDFRVDGEYTSGSVPGYPPAGQGTSILAQLHGYL